MCVCMFLNGKGSSNGYGLHGYSLVLERERVCVCVHVFKR